MTRFMRFMRDLGRFSYMLLMCLVDGVCYLGLCLRSPTALAAENLFLRKQLALYQERHVKPRRATHATRVTLVWLARWFDWRQALAADGQRAVAEAGPTGVTTHRPEVPAEAPGSRPGETRSIPVLADLCPQSCPGHRRL
jgi:hypothetical protein